MQMNWKRLLCDRRIGVRTRARSAGDLRTEFEKDYHRIIGSSSFRRLQDKTQVFALDKSDFIRTRLTHSLEVSSFAKSIGQNVGRFILENHLDDSFTIQNQGDICDILQCAGLIHDIGNPPFGHFGEEAIRDWFERRMQTLYYKGKPLTELLTPQMLQDFYHFEGNAQVLRQVAKLHFLQGENGMNLTCALLNTVIKYPVSSLQIRPESGDLKEKKLGYFYAEQDLYRTIAEETGAVGVRHPLAYILEAADDIAYKTADIEDAFKKGFISYERLHSELMDARELAEETGPTDPVALLDQQLSDAVLRGVDDPTLYAVQNLAVRLQSDMIYLATKGFTDHYREIMEGTFTSDLFAGTGGEWVMEALGDIAFRYAFSSRVILQMEVSAGTILDYLMDRFIPAVLYYDTERQLPLLDRKIVSLISQNYRQVYHIYSSRTDDEVEKLYLRLLLVTDFISGMTDTYARDMYQKMSGIS